MAPALDSCPELCYFNPAWIEPTDRVVEAEVCVYGGTAGGVIAAIAAAGRGRSVVLAHPGRFLGGMTTGGLSLTDLGNKAVVGGLAREFYRRCGQRVGLEEDWKFDPSTAQGVLDDWIADADVPVYRGAFVDTVEMEGGRLRAARMLGGLTVRARAFIDATYEGDLMARAGVSHTTGREANAVYGETFNGVQVLDSHQFSHGVDPYVTPGDITSGYLPHIDPQTDAPRGSGDHRIQAYCFRVCMSDDPAVKLDWVKPEGFDPAEYELAVRWYNSEKSPRSDTLREGGNLAKFDRLTHQHKADVNNHGPFSSDFIGANYAWPQGDYPTRERLFQDHLRYQRGFYWLMAHDRRIPPRYREAFGAWGLASDEFPATGHWPHQLYVREGRRMVGDYVLTEHDCMGRAHCEDPVGMGAYTMDSHNCQRLVRDGRVFNEGNVEERPAAPYPVSYRSVVPRRGECENLAVPIALSASHIAFGSVRMEPVFMVLGQSAAIAIDLALEADRPLQDLPYRELSAALTAAGQVLSTEAINAASGNPE